MLINTKSIAFLLATVALFGCDSGQNNSANPSVKQRSNDEQAVLSILYQQTAAEYQALCHQAYNMARLRLDMALKGEKANWDKVIITDLDETALDNSDFYGWLYENNMTYSESSWTEWVELRQANPIPGSVSFFQYADSMEVNVFYISNRDTSHVNATKANLEAFGFPQTKKENMLFKAETSSKVARRKVVEDKYTEQNILMLLGDNLNDFHSFYDKKYPNADIKRKVDSVKRSWGKKFIVFPNANYGDWDFRLYDYKFSENIQFKDSMRLLNLRSVKGMPSGN
ncbi:MAG: 5'-nucleotidase, lipoprotein e(P4) family [Reichenbachiella sp.]|uniref:5'-nucleotidase, lipoprotein e(P4) family n=1 Tax=Reichenbachiella sp. TaxID=2184521 RepID=UPI00326490FB